MENNRNENSNQENQLQQEQNETLNRPGASVADYGNVTGGSAVKSHADENTNENRSGENASDTIGNP